MEAIKTARIDAWESRLTDSEQRELYRWTQTPIDRGDGSGARRPGYDECMAHLAELGLERPGRSSWFRFKTRMEKERRLEMLYSIQASGESAKDLSSMSPADYELASNVFTNLAIDASMKGNDKAVAIYSGAARHYREMVQNEKALDLKSAAQATKDEQLRLAREKFEFDAAKRAMELAAEIKTVAADDSLDDDEKIQKVREALFG